MYSSLTSLTRSSCGFGPDFCGDGCKVDCDAKAECGQHSTGNASCLLNVCYSEVGFCGTTDNFCGPGCPGNNCGPAKRPVCLSEGDYPYARRIGYYDMSTLYSHRCNQFLPEHIAAGALTHVNLACALIDFEYKITDDYEDIVRRTAKLKRKFSSLRVMIAVSAWALNDCPTQHLFGVMVNPRETRRIFIDSCVDFLTKYGLDGIDLDWEYPVVEDRGGVPDDYDNYVLLLADMRERFDAKNLGWELSLTLPSSYWYLRGFNVKAIEKYVDFFNLMSYDLHGIWDMNNNFTGPYLRGHTNATVIDQGLDLLWVLGSSDSTSTGHEIPQLELRYLDGCCHPGSSDSSTFAGEMSPSDSSALGG